jgi:hypothetical protein
MLIGRGRVCRGCGCTETHACEGGCCWVLFDIPQTPIGPTGVCSACAEEVGWSPGHMAMMGLDELCNDEARAILAPVNRGD